MLNWIINVIRGISPQQRLPLALIIIQICAAIPYVRVGEWKKALYWLFAAGLNITVTF